ncbi:MAG: hypothetical protein A2X94_08305 [Bdellovibrionales bacterium GWB1_55_8]|nr:MAG: hypothetical protein A2X94_08305 [Bdellovibrionales bacterium GWB1_55_8]
MDSVTMDPVKQMEKASQGSPNHAAGKGVIESPEIKRGGFLKNIFTGMISLAKGMKVTFHYFSHPSTVVTQQYPENRDTLKMFDRFRAHLTMAHDEKGQHKCSGCQICQKACPNASISVVNRSNPVTGKKELDRYVWRMDSCTFCNMCVQVCPFGTLKMENQFESSVYDRRLLVYTLNRYAGPTAQVLGKLESDEERTKQMEPRDPYSGPTPMNGQAMAGVAALGEKKGEGESK